MDSPIDLGLFISFFNTGLGVENKKLNEKQLLMQKISQIHLHREIMNKLDEILKELQNKNDSIRNISKN